MTKIDIISGFLGAGKTTLIKKLINEALTGEKLVLIENEFGEIGIDGGFLKDSGCAEDHRETCAYADLLVLPGAWSVSFGDLCLCTQK